MDKYLGKRIDGRYEIHELLGVGGMAYVYRAYDNQAQRDVAIKILKDEYAQNSDFLRRFRNESRAVAMLSHPNIVKVYDVSFGDVIQYIIMEYVDGITLKDYITRQGVLSWREALHFTVQILRALQHAHEKGIIHRDVKPQNIMLLEDGTIKVTDFGIARFVQSETQTVTDKALGSVHYIAPEQARGDFTSEKVDIYSVGVMMYEMLTGQLPFEADNAVSVAIMQMQSVAKKPRDINPQIPVGLEEITMKAMEKNPSMRFQSATEMLLDIESFRANPSITFNYNYKQDMEATRQMDIFENVQSAPASGTRRAAPVYHDDYEYEEELVKSTKRAKGSMVVTGIVAAVIVAALCFVVVIIFNSLTGQEPVSDEIELTNFLGMNYVNDIENNSEYSDLEFIVSYSKDENAEDGVVLKQSPTGGIMVKKGREVELTVNRLNDEASFPVPDVTGKTQTEGFNTLQAAGLVPEIRTVNDNETAAEYIIRTEPSAGADAKDGDSIIIFVSIGPAEQQVKIPDIKGLTLSYATTLLESSNLVVGEVTYDDESDKPRDEIISCSPDVGESVAEGSTVNIVCSSGAKTEKTWSENITLPAGVNSDLEIKIYVNGVLTDTNTVNPYYVGAYSTTFTGTTGIASVVVQLNGSDYIYGDVDYDTQSFNISQQIPFTDPNASTSSEEGSSETETGEGI